MVWSHQGLGVVAAALRDCPHRGHHLLRTHGVAGGLDPIAGAFVVVSDDIHTALTSTDPRRGRWRSP